jgi:hypothetical protein
MKSLPIVDTNAYTGRWPSRRLWGEELADLVAESLRHDVGSVWVSSFEALLHRDVAGVNERLLESSRRYGAERVELFGCIDPTLPDWEEDLRRCAEVYRMRGIRLHPNYHGYGLENARFTRLVAIASEMGLLVQIAVSMEDERTQHPLLRVKPVALAPLVDALEQVPRARIMVLNAMRTLLPNRLLLRRLVRARVVFDTAMLEGVTALEHLFSLEPDMRIAFGSYAPFFVYEAAALQLEESELSAAHLAAVRSEIARLVLSPV